MMKVSCTPRFFASYNFDGFGQHDESNKKYWVIVDGPNAAIYTLKASAERALPRLGDYEVNAFHRIAEALDWWRIYCRTDHRDTCDLYELTDPEMRYYIRALPLHNLQYPGKPLGPTVKPPGAPDSWGGPFLASIRYPATRLNLPTLAELAQPGGQLSLPPILPFDIRAMTALHLNADGTPATGLPPPPAKRGRPRKRSPTVEIVEAKKRSLYADDEDSPSPSPSLYNYESPSPSLYNDESPSTSRNPSPVRSETVAKPVRVKEEVRVKTEHGVAVRFKPEPANMASSISFSIGSMSSPPTSVSSVSASTSTPSAARSGVGIERRRSADKPASTSTPSAARSGVGTERRRSAAKEAGPSLVLPDPARLASTPSISTDRSASSRFRKTPSRSSSPTKQPASRSASPVKKSSAFPPSIFATSSDTPVWVYNERQGFIYKDVRYAMRDMQDEDRRLKVVRSGVEMQEVLSAGAVLRQGVKEEEDFEAIEIEQIEDSDVEMH